MSKVTRYFHIRTGTKVFGSLEAAREAAKDKARHDCGGEWIVMGAITGYTRDKPCPPPVIRKDY